MGRVQLAIPTYNRGDRIRQTVEACLAQSYADVEVLVVDNASEDGTADILAELSAKHPRLRVVINDENLGMIGNFQRCLELAEGEYFKIVCSDDLPHERLVERQVAALDDHSGVVACTARRSRLTDQPLYRYYDRVVELSGGRHAGASAVRHLFRVSNAIGGPVQVLTRLEALRGHGFSTDAEIGFFFDIDPVVRLLAAGGDLIVLDEVLCTYNSEQSSTTARTLLSPEAQRCFFSYRELLWEDPVVRACLQDGDLVASRRRAAILLSIAAFSGAPHGSAAQVEAFFAWLGGRAPAEVRWMVRALGSVSARRAKPR